MSIKLVALMVALSAAVALATPQHQQWAFFKAHHHKTYKSKAEEAHRFAIFQENMKLAADLEKRNPRAKFGASPYADMTKEEFAVYHNGKAHYEKAVEKIAETPFHRKFTEEELKATPKSVDWRKKGAVTHVKNQAQCGSCWSFSTTGGVEGQWFLAGNTLTSLSEQELVSCDTIDDGCNGGLMSNAYNWLLEKREGKLVTAASYPYVSGMGNVPKCNMTGKVFGAKIDGHENIYHTEDQMAAWTARRGPLSVAVAAGLTWQLYFGGVMEDCGTGQLDHGVLIVGYEEAIPAAKPTPYWIIKNSWGPDWGEKGYLYVGKGSNQCSVTQYPVSAIVGTVPTQPPATPVQKGYFRHTVFDNANCTLGANPLVWEQGKCVEWDGVSFKATCGASEITVEAYYHSLNCTGAKEKLTEKIDTCATSSAGDVYYKNECPAAADLTQETNRKAVENIKRLFGKK